MTGSRLLIGVASVLAGTTVLLGVFGLVYNPILLLAAVPFAASTYLLWTHATGRLEARIRERTDRHSGVAGARPDERFGSRGRRDPTRRSTAGRRSLASEREPEPDAEAAARVLGVDPGADDETIRNAFREKAKSLHPDAAGGDEVAFRRVRAAYERLTDGR